MRSPLVTAACLGLSLSIVPVALAQMHNNTDKQMTCGNHYGGDRARHCEIREQTLPSVGRLDAESHNGSMTVKGWLRSDVLVRARVEAEAYSQSAADSLASQVSLEAGGGQVRATGPENRGDNDNSWWSVSYEIFVPQVTDLKIASHNGEVAISDVRGQIGFDAHNGAVHLNRISGDVNGGSHNGAIDIALIGSFWEGRQLEVVSHNGSITLSMPAGYSAHVVAEADNGGFRSDFPITVTGELHARPRRLDTNIGSGGALMHLTTHNGQVTLKRITAQ